MVSPAPGPRQFTAIRRRSTGSCTPAGTEILFTVSLCLSAPETHSSSPPGAHSEINQPQVSGSKQPGSWPNATSESCDGKSDHPGISWRSGVWAVPSGDKIDGAMKKIADHIQ